MNIAIIGAGLAGLTAAYEIHKQQPEAQISVFEATDRIGGKLYTVPFESGPTEMGAEAYLAFRTDATEFFKELGLGELLRSPSGLPSMLYADGQTYPMPAANLMGIPANGEGLEGLLSAETIAAINAEVDGPGIQWGPEDVSLGALVRERYGDDVVDRIVSALQGGVYSSSSDDLGIRATVPHLAAQFDAMVEAGEKVTLAGAVGKLLADRAARNAARGYKPAVFSSFAGGYAEVYEALAEKSGAKIHIDAFISGVSAHRDGGYVLKGADSQEPFDRVLFATPAPTTAMLLRDIAPEASKLLKQIQLASSALVGMRFADATGLPDYSGILVAQGDTTVHAKAFTFSSKKWPHLLEGTKYADGAVVRASFGRFGDDAITRAEEDDLVDYALDDLKTITGFDGREAGLEEIYVQRWFGGLPVYSPQHMETVAAVFAALQQVPGVEATGAWAHGVGVPSVIADAKSAAQRVLA